MIFKHLMYWCDNGNTSECCLQTQRNTSNSTYIYTFKIYIYKSVSLAFLGAQSENPSFSQPSWSYKICFVCLLVQLKCDCTISSYIYTDANRCLASTCYSMNVMHNTHILEMSEMNIYIWLLSINMTIQVIYLKYTFIYIFKYTCFIICR